MKLCKCLKNLFHRGTTVQTNLPERSRKMSREDMAKCYARVFSTPDGQKVLNHLQITTFMRCGGLDTDNKALRHMDGQRALVQQILRLVETGRAGKQS